MNGETKENLEKPQSMLMVDPKTLFQKHSVNPEKLQLNVCIRINQKDRAPEDISPVCSEIFLLTLCI